MAQQTLDQQGNEAYAIFVGKLTTMFNDLYALLSGVAAASVATLTSAGLLTTQSLRLDTGTKTATAVSGAATLNKSAGIITSEAITTAAGADYTLTLTNSDIASGDSVFASVYLSTTGGTPTVAAVTPSAGQVIIVVQNIHATVAFGGAIKIPFMILKA
jgi:hypothetical protein